MKKALISIFAISAAVILSGCELNTAIQDLHESITDVNDSLSKVTGRANTTTESEDSKDTKTIVKTGVNATYSEIAAAYKKNPVTAEQKYLGSTITFKGKTKILLNDTVELTDSSNNRITYFSTHDIGKEWNNGEVYQVTGTVDMIYSFNSIDIRE